MKSFLVAFASVAAIAAAAPASAAIIDLELNTSLGGFSHAQDGFTVTSSSGFDGTYGNWNLLGQPNFNAGGSNATILQNYGGYTNTLTKDDGAAFTFNGISLADVYNNGSGGTVRFDFNRADGTSASQTIALALQTGLQAFTFDQADLTSVAFTPLTTQGQWLQFDRLVVNEAVSGAVPEPATWAMLVLGFGLVGAAARRRHTMTLAAA